MGYTPVFQEVENSLSILQKFVGYILQSWLPWVSLVMVSVLWGLPRIPHYQDWLPYGYDLGGPALVALYMALGFGSLGMFGLVTGFIRLEYSPERRHRALLLGGGGFVLAGSFVGLYMFLMNVSLSLM